MSFISGLRIRCITRIRRLRCWRGNTFCARRLEIAAESVGHREVDHSLVQPFTFDLPELDELIKIAKEKKLFLMEAVWTRFVSSGSWLQSLLCSTRIAERR
jgi:hypothetical protein